ncbi:MAG: HEAT repeat domain-containing protein, partial [Vicinamibacterales bacterium]
LNTSDSVNARRNGVWALTRIEGAQAREAVRIALADRDASVRQAAIHSAGLWRDAAAVPQLVEAVKSGVPAVQRVAAEALGRAGDSRAVPDLIATAASQHDRVLEHSLTYALIEIDDPASTVASGLQAASSRARRAALIALDQMDRGRLQADGLISLFDSPDPVLKETAWWIAGHHPEWGGAVAAFFQKQLTDGTSGAAEREDLERKLAQFGQNPAIQELLAETVTGAASPAARISALRAMAAAASSSPRLKELPSAWVAPVVRSLDDRDPETTRHALAVVRVAPAPGGAAADLRAALMRVAGDKARAPGLRLDALAAVPGGLTAVEPDLFDLLLTSLEPARPMPIRSAAAAVLEKATLDPQQLLLLAQSLETTGPLELSRLLRAFDKTADEKLGLAMIAGLERSTSRSSVRADLLRPLLAKYPQSVQKAGEALLASLNMDSARQAGHLEDLLVASQGGDVRRGQAVFNSPKAACFSCHAIGYLGGRLGPDLTKVGQVRSDRDLLEAIVFPNASFARGYEPVIVRTTSGDVHGGVLRSDLADEVVLAIGEREEERIPRREIVDMQPGSVSLMPSGFDEQLTRQELADLLAFLKATRS